MKRANGVKAIISLVAIFLVGAFVLSGQAKAQQSKVIELTYGTPLNSENTFTQADRQWMAKIEEETGGRVKFKPYYGGTLIGSRDGIDELTKGVADVAFILPSNSNTGYHIARGSFLFFTNASLETGPRVFSEMMRKFPEIEGEYNKGIKVVCWASGTSYFLPTHNRPVRKIADLKGMRIRATGEMISLLRDLRAEGVMIPASDVYMSMQKGILDGALMPAESLKTMRLAEVAKYVTDIGLYRAPIGTTAINRDAYNKLPPDIQKIIDNSIEWCGRNHDRIFEKADKEGLEFAKTKGTEVITLPKDELGKLYSEVGKEAARQAKELDGKGLPGTRIYQEAQSLIQKYGK